MSTSVVIAVAEAIGVDPVEMDEPLNEFVDPDALDALVASMDEGRVSFSVAGVDVEVAADGAVTVRED